MYYIFWLCIHSLRYPACNAHAPYCHLWPVRLSYLPALSHKRYDEKKVIEYTTCWITIDQLDVTCFIISLFNAQHVSDVNTSILRSLRLICWVISWVVLLWFDVCWCYGVVWLGWCGRGVGYHTSTHLDTGFSWFPCVYKQMLRWFPIFLVATTCFSCSPPDLNIVVTNFIFCLHVK